MMLIKKMELESLGFKVKITPNEDMEIMPVHTDTGLEHVMGKQLYEQGYTKVESDIIIEQAVQAANRVIISRCVEMV